MREIGTPKIGLHISNSHIKRPRITVNQRIGSRKEAISTSHIREIADKKTAYNEGCLYCEKRKLLVQAALIICVLFIRGFAYSRSRKIHQNSLFPIYPLLIHDYTEKFGLTKV